ncbi:hypothetical protein [Curtobacterium sp. NPDC089185]|uniref:hypothetical protein n=1 Tax=Curtobacterium sp. NPDC089185 TaxID=3154968 RepID=UPI003425D832
MKLKQSMALAIAMTAVLLMGGTTVANAASPEDTWSEPQSVTFDAPASSAGSSSTARAAAASKITCTVQTNSAHYSDGSNGVIAKIRASCKGTCGCEPTVSVRVQGLLSWSSTESPYTKYKKVRTTDTTKTFKTDGTQVTTYIPQLGQDGYRANGWYIATGTLDPADAPAVSSTNGPRHVTDVP